MYLLWRSQFPRNTSERSLRSNCTAALLKNNQDPPRRWQLSGQHSSLQSHRLYNLWCIFKRNEQIWWTFMTLLMWSCLFQPCECPFLMYYFLIQVSSRWRMNEVQSCWHLRSKNIHLAQQMSSSCVQREESEVIFSPDFQAETFVLSFQHVICTHIHTPMYEYFKWNSSVNLCFQYRGDRVFGVRRAV